MIGPVGVEHRDVATLGRGPPAVGVIGHGGQHVGGGGDRLGVGAVDLSDGAGTGGDGLAVDDQQSVGPVVDIELGGAEAGCIDANGHLVAGGAAQEPGVPGLIHYGRHLVIGLHLGRQGPRPSGEIEGQDLGAIAERDDPVPGQDGAAAVDAGPRAGRVLAVVDDGHGILRAHQRGGGRRVDESRALGRRRRALRPRLDQTRDAVDQHELRTGLARHRQPGPAVEVLRVLSGGRRGHRHADPEGEEGEDGHERDRPVSQA